MGSAEIKLVIPVRHLCHAIDSFMDLIMKKRKEKEKVYQATTVGDPRKQGNAKIKCSWVSAFGDSQLGSPGDVQDSP